MKITIEDFKKLTPEVQNFVLTYGAEQCLLVKFVPNLIEILFDVYDENAYNGDDITLLETISSDGKWHLVHTYDHYDYFIKENDSILVFEECFLDESENIKHLIDQK